MAEEIKKEQTEFEETLERVAKQREIDEQNRADQERRDFLNSTDRVCELIQRARVEKKNRPDNALEIIANVRVPAEAVSQVTKRIRFRDEYPCITAFFCGIMSGLAIGIVAVATAVLI